MLEQGEWDNLRKWRDTLLVQRVVSPDPAQRTAEESAADYMNRFLEFDNKQECIWGSMSLVDFLTIRNPRSKMLSYDFLIVEFQPL